MKGHACARAMFFATSLGVVNIVGDKHVTGTRNVFVHRWMSDSSTLELQSEPTVMIGGKEVSTW